jgi:hypothetical protein
LADFQPLAGSKMAGHTPAAPSNRATPGCGLENAMTQNSPPPDHALARRTVLKGASLGVGAGLMSGLTAAAQAQTTGTGHDSRHP